jgi:tRNA pseudouridine55 synthase
VLEARPVKIHSFEITNIQLPVIGFKVTCSTGTYIRSLANDFGESLGTGGYLSSLCRTRIGEYLLADAISLTDFERQIEEAKKTSEWQANA